MELEEMQSRIKLNSMVLTPGGWKYACYNDEEGVRATDYIDDLSPYPPFYTWDQIRDVKD